MQKLLQQFKIEQTGFVFIADKSGLIQLHKDSNKVAKANIDSVYEANISNEILSSNGFRLKEIDLDGQATLVAATPIENTDLFIVA
ncbi:hypothetical protein, partial [Pseudomonas sp. SIMBA_021]